MTYDNTIGKCMTLTELSKEAELTDLSQELERGRCIAIVDAVREHQKAFEAGGMPTPFSSGFDLACEEIKHRILLERWQFDCTIALKSEG